MCKNRDCPPGKYGITITKYPGEKRPYHLNIYYKTGLTGGYTVPTDCSYYRTKLGATIGAFAAVRKEKKYIKQPIPKRSSSPKVVRKMCL